MTHYVLVTWKVFHHICSHFVHMWWRLIVTLHCAWHRKDHRGREWFYHSVVFYTPNHLQALFFTIHFLLSYSILLKSALSIFVYSDIIFHYHSIKSYITAYQDLSLPITRTLVILQDSHVSEVSGVTRRRMLALFSFPELTSQFFWELCLITCRVLARG